MRRAPKLRPIIKRGVPHEPSIGSGVCRRCGAKLVDDRPAAEPFCYYTYA